MKLMLMDIMTRWSRLFIMEYDAGFIRIEALNMFHVCNTPEDVLDIIEHRI